MLDVKSVVLGIAIAIAYYVAKAIAKAVKKAVMMRRKMTVTVKLRGIILVQQTMRLSSLSDDQKLLETIGHALDNSPLAGAEMVGEPKEEKIGKFGRRYTVQFRKETGEEQCVLEMLPAVI